MAKTSAPSEAALRLHRESCARGDRMYRDPESGLYVQTSVHLAARGHCCGAGCRHCPYDAEAQARAQRPTRDAWPLRPTDAGEPER